MDIELQRGSHKSIREFKWCDVPRFAVITGPNGSGKSGLLELMARGANAPTHDPDRRHMSGLENPELMVALSEPHEHGSAVFMRSSWPMGGGSLNTDALLSSINEIWNYRHRRHPPDAMQYEPIWKVIEAAGVDPQTMTREQFNELLPANFAMLQKRRVDANMLCSLFVSYQYLIDNGTSEKELSPLPWDVVNDGLATAGLQYTVSRPVTTPAIKWTNSQITYNFLLKDKITGAEVQPTALSSGETVMLQVALWQFAFSQVGSDAPERLLLLDEPDAHLHPALTSAFLRVVKSELVEKHGIRVIMTTHSPSTVSLVDEENLFVMNKGAATPVRPESKWAALSQLTAGFLTIGNETKTVFVEDDHDRFFYNEVQQCLLDPLRMTPQLDRRKAINFVSASKGDKSGGCQKVKSWVADIESTQIAGIIDKDTSNQEGDRIYVLGRYAMENYLLDPIYLYSYLLDNAKAELPDVGFQLTSEERQNILSIGNEKLQVIADTMLKIYQELMQTEPDGTKIDVTYVGGYRVQLQSWFISMKLKPLIGKLKTERGWETDIVHLSGRYKSKQIIPNELLKIMQRIQAQ